MQEAIETMQTELEERLRFETLLAEISSRFVNVPADQVDGEIEDAQRRICELLDLDRATLWQLSDKEARMLLTHAHHTREALRFPKEMKGKEIFPWITQEIRAGETVIFAKVSDLPPEARRDRESCRLYGTKSAVIVPVSIGRGPVFAALTFAVTREERDWPETVVKGLQLIVQVFANALARRQTEKALHESEARLSLATNAGGVGLWAMELDTGHVWVTTRIRELFHFTPEEKLNAESFFRAIHHEDRERVKQAVQQSLQSGESLGIDCRIVQPDGSIRWIIARGQRHLQSAGGPDRMMGVGFDVTDRNRAREALEQSERKLHLLSSHLLTAHEAERKRISKELHDQLGQDLIGLKLHVGSIQRELTEGKIAVSHEFESVREEIDQIIENVRRLSRDLGPYALEHLGLWQALRYLTEELTKHYLVKNSFDILSSDTVLPQSTQLNIFRVFQEALTNIQKHADAAHVSIEVGEKDGTFSFLIEDDGKGFDVAQGKEGNPTEKGLGLVIMEERVRILGGVLDIRSQKGKGTRISFTVPVDREGKQG